MVAAPSLTQAERIVANALNAHITRNEEVSLTSLAAECHVAKSTVVKTLQKIGFRGYQEFSYNYRINQDMQRGTLLPRNVVEGNREELVDELAHLLMTCAHKKNLVFLGGRRMGALLAHYVSRKLAMFDIFAPASYDYAMVNESWAVPGVAFFFFHQDPTRGFGQSGTGDSMLKTVRDQGFVTVVFTDMDDARIDQASDLLLRITNNADPGVDLFASKVIMVFEDVLSAYSKCREEAHHDNEQA